MKSEPLRHATQFRLWHLLWLMSLVAIVLAILRLGVVAGAVIVFIGSELIVVVFGTVIFIARGRTTLATMIGRGILGGSCLAGLCFGWIPVLLFILQPSPGPALALGAIVATGALLGVVIGLIHRWVVRRRQTRNMNLAAPTGMHAVHWREIIEKHLTDPAIQGVTDRAKRILRVAFSHALDRQQAFVTPEHVLLALATQDRGVGQAALEALGVDLTTQRDRLAELITPMTAIARVTQPFLSPQSEWLLDATKAAAKSLGNDYIGTEHLVLGLMSCGDCPAVRYLAAQGVGIERFRVELRRILGPMH